MIKVRKKLQGGIPMKRVLIVGAGKGGSALLEILYNTDRMKIIGVVDRNTTAPGLNKAKKYGIPTDYTWENWINKDIDIIIEATGDENVLENLLERRNRKTVVIPGTVAYIISELFEEKESLLDRLKIQTNNQELILNNIRDGMIVINNQEIVQFVNKSAERIVGISKDKFKEQDIKHVIADTRLPHVLRSRRKEVNQKLVLENDKKVITTRIPIINADDRLIGAFAVFKDITEVMNLAEENTDLKEIKTMLEAIIQSSDEAISVVDENGTGIMKIGRAHV